MATCSQKSTGDSGPWFTSSWRKIWLAHNGQSSIIYFVFTKISKSRWRNSANWPRDRPMIPMSTSSWDLTHPRSELRPITTNCKSGSQVHIMFKWAVSLTTTSQFHSQNLTPFLSSSVPTYLQAMFFFPLLYTIICQFIYSFWMIIKHCLSAQYLSGNVKRETWSRNETLVEDTWKSTRCYMMHWGNRLQEGWFPHLQRPPCSKQNSGTLKWRASNPAEGYCGQQGRAGNLNNWGQFPWLQWQPDEHHPITVPSLKRGNPVPDEAPSLSFWAQLMAFSFLARHLLVTYFFCAYSTYFTTYFTPNRPSLKSKCIFSLIPLIHTYFHFFSLNKQDRRSLMRECKDQHLRVHSLAVIVMTFWYVFGMDLTFSNFFKLSFGIDHDLHVPYVHITYVSFFTQSYDQEKSSLYYDLFNFGVLFYRRIPTFIFYCSRGALHHQTRRLISGCANQIHSLISPYTECRPCVRVLPLPNRSR